VRNVASITFHIKAKKGKITARAGDDDRGDIWEISWIITDECDGRARERGVVFSLISSS